MPSADRTRQITSLVSGVRHAHGMAMGSDEHAGLFAVLFRGSANKWRRPEAEV